MRQGIPQVRQVVGSQLHLRGNYDCGLDRQFGMFVADNHHGRGDLLHGELGQFALAGLQYVVIATAAATARLRLRGFQEWKRPGIDQSHRYSLCRGRFHDVASNQSTCYDDGRDQNVYTRGTERSIPLVIVETPNIFDRLGLGFELQWRGASWGRRTRPVAGKVTSTGALRNYP